MKVLETEQILKKIIKHLRKFQAIWKFLKENLVKICLKIENILRKFVKFKENLEDKLRKICRLNEIFE